MNLPLLFTDNFHRPNGTVGNGWSTYPDETQCSVASNQLTMGDGGGVVELYRPTVDSDSAISIVIPTSAIYQGSNSALLLDIQTASGTYYRASLGNNRIYVISGGNYQGGNAVVWATPEAGPTTFRVDLDKATGAVSAAVTDANGQTAVIVPYVFGAVASAVTSVGILNVGDEPQTILAANVYGLNPATTYVAKVAASAYAGDKAPVAVVAPVGKQFSAGLVVTVVSSTGDAGITISPDFSRGKANYLPTAPGLHTLTFTNNQGLADPAPVTVVVHPGVEQTGHALPAYAQGNQFAPTQREYLAQISTTAGRAYNAFMAGESVGFILPDHVQVSGVPSTLVITSYEVRDFDGAIVSSGAVALPQTLHMPEVTQPGWYRLDLFNAAQTGTLGDKVGDLFFAVLPAGSALPTPGTVSADFTHVTPSGGGSAIDLTAYNFGTDEYMRALLGGAAGPQRFPVDPGNTPSQYAPNIATYLAMEKGADIHRPARKLIFAFRDYPVGYGTGFVTTFVQGLLAAGLAATDFVVEAKNEPNDTDPTAYAATLGTFYAEVKAASPAVQVIGPATVTILPPSDYQGNVGLGWWDTFLAAGGGSHLDEISFHFYNCMEGDWNEGRAVMDNFVAYLASKGLGGKPLWQTEQGDAYALYGVNIAYHSTVWTMARLLLLEQYGLPAERNYYWEDHSSDPNWFVSLISDKGSPMPNFVALRTWGAELYGKTHASKYAFGGSRDRVYVGSLFTGASGSTAVFVSTGDTQGSLGLTLTGAASVTVVQWDGKTSLAPALNGQFTLPLGMHPTYVRLPAGVSLAVADSGWGANLLAGVSAAVSDGTTTDLLTNGTFGAGYGYPASPWMIEPKNADTGVSPQYGPVAIEFDLPAAQTINRLHVHCPVQWQDAGTLQDYRWDVWSGNAWTPVVQRTEPVRFVPCYCRNTSSTLDDYSPRRCVYQDTFAPVLTSRVRLTVNAASYGGSALLMSDGGSGGAGGQSWGFQRLTISQVEAYHATAPAPLLPPLPVITSALTAAGTAGVVFSYHITAASEPDTFGASGLPAPLQLDTITGEIHGTPAAAGVYLITISATKAGGTGTATLVLTVAAAASLLSGLTVEQAAQLALLPGLVAAVAALTAQLSAADQILLASPYVPANAPAIVLPAPSTDANGCVVYAALDTPGNVPAASRRITFAPKSPGAKVGGRLVTGDEIVKQSGTDGSLSVTLIRGVEYSVSCADLFRGHRYFTATGASMDLSELIKS